jgi:16S rRNA (cytidine1402-2'-O)-methyltransferase
MEKTGILYIVATPIGNLSDITLRALETLREVDAIACEDTRVTVKLLNRYEIGKTLISYHQHSKLYKIDVIINKLKEGNSIALVTDAGTPGISDPGNILVEEAVKNNISVVPIPGSSALAAIISVAGIDMQKFIFMGFPPHKKGRETFFKEVASCIYPVVYYESPYRLLKNLELLDKIAPEKEIVIGRELTKMFEEVFRGKVDQAIKHFGGKMARIKGELAIIVC